MSEEEAIKLLKEEPDYSLSYYKREYAVDIVLKKNKQLHSIIKEVRELLKRYQNNEYYYKYDGKYLKSEIKEDILEILNKVQNEENK